jgi:hypothetical protein
MAEIKTKSKKERQILASFKNVPLPNLREVIEKVGDRYRAEYPIYDQNGDKLLLARGKTISDDRMRQLELSNLRHLRTHKEPKYYFQRKKPDEDFG